MCNMELDQKIFRSRSQLIWIYTVFKRNIIRISDFSRTLVACQITMSIVCLFDMILHIPSRHQQFFSYKGTGFP